MNSFASPLSRSFPSTCIGGREGEGRSGGILGKTMRRKVQSGGNNAEEEEGRSQEEGERKGRKGLEMAERTEGGEMEAVVAGNKGESFGSYSTYIKPGSICALSPFIQGTV